jgi:deoxyribonuclease IV
MLGSTVPTIGGLHNGFRVADSWGCECIQIYVTLSRKWEVADLQQKEVTAFAQAWRTSRVKQVVAHVPYLVNVASPDDVVRTKAQARLETEFERATRFGVPILILHPGGYKSSSAEEGLQRIVTALDKVLARFPQAPTRILLETMAGQGTMLGARFEELAHILGSVREPARLGVCFDTTHVFAAGYDLRGYGGYEKVLCEFNRMVGFTQIAAFHINDSRYGLGSHHDRHAWIGQGELGLQVFHALVRDARFREVPMILEMPDFEHQSEQNLTLLRRLREREKPFTTRSEAMFRERYMGT